MELFNSANTYLTNVPSQCKRISHFENIRLMVNVLKGGHCLELHVPNIKLNTKKKYQYLHIV